MIYGSMVRPFSTRDHSTHEGNHLSYKPVSQVALKVSGQARVVASHRTKICNGAAEIATNISSSKIAKVMYSTGLVCNATMRQ